VTASNLALTRRERAAEPLIVRLTARPWFRRAVYRLLRARARRIVDDIQPWLAPGDDIVDIGAGTCNVFEVLTERGHRVTPVDVKPMSIVPGVVACNYNGRDLPFSDGRFDVALLITVLHHAEDPDRVVAEAARVARRLIVMEDLVGGGAHTRWTHFVDSVTNFEFRGHPHSNRSDAAWQALFRSLGLRIASLRYHKSFGGMRHATYHLVRD
jgi:SAM-dependent methyltransferase